MSQTPHPDHADPAVPDSGDGDPAGPSPAGDLAIADGGDAPGADDGELGARDPERDGADSGDAALDQPIDWDQRAVQDGRSPGELLAALGAATVERDQYLDQLRRKQAEFDNFRKRMARDAQAQRAAGRQAVATALLDVLDDFDRTIAALEADDAARKGVALVRDKLLDALAAQGLERIEADGSEFDPNLHEAVQQVPGDGGEPIVAEVLRSGWTMDGRVLRAAMVVVAQ